MLRLTLLRAPLGSGFLLGLMGCTPGFQTTPSTASTTPVALSQTSASAALASWVSTGPSTISAQANIGIGTTTPDQALTVNGVIHTSAGGIEFPDGTTQITASADNNGVANGLTSNADNVNTTGWYRSNGAVGWYNNSFGGGLWMSDPSWIRTYGNKNFYVQGASLAVDGNVGIGTTSPGNKLDVAGGISMTNSVDNSFNLFHTGPNGNNWSISNLAGAANAGGLRFYNGTNAAEYLRITNAGNVGIGTAVPIAPLDVAGLIHASGTTKPNISAQGAYLGWNALTGGTGETDLINNQGGGAGGFAFMNTAPPGASSSTLMFISGGGKVGIGTTTPGATLEVLGNASFTQNVTAPTFTMSSDVRLKERIAPLDPSLEKIMNLSPVQYFWNSTARERGIIDPSRQFGFIAQELEAPFPEAVKTGADGYKSINYPALIAPLVQAFQQFYAESHDREVQDAQALQERDGRIDALEKRLADLERKMVPTAAVSK